jgi:AcrR family transcriptional regulator
MWEQDLRIEKTLMAIEKSFYKCIEIYSFEQMTISDIVKEARINRTTFYRHYENKYDLRDCILDQIMKNFDDKLICNFLNINPSNLFFHFADLMNLMDELCKNKVNYLTLWESDLGNRNLFNEMIERGTAKIQKNLETCSYINKKKEPFYGLYARLFMSMLMTHVRWWFTEGSHINLGEITNLMLEHMSTGPLAALQPLKNISE